MHAPVTPTLNATPDAASPTPSVPDYLQQDYWWAYVHPNAVRVFERPWLVNLILFGNYNRLRDRALDLLAGAPGAPVTGSTLQVACVYGDLTPRLCRRMAPEAKLSVLDVLPIQLINLGRKLGTEERVLLRRGDSSALPDADASHDQTLLFFLLHEQPEATRRATLREALRVTRPGGRVVIVDYHRPHALHPLRPLMRLVFGGLEPFAMDLWRHPLTDFLPTDLRPQRMEHFTVFGGLYQIMVLQR